MKKIILIAFICLSFLPLQSTFIISSAELSSAQMQSSNIMVAGSAVINGSGNGMLARYTATGLLDTSFATSGVASLFLGGTTQINDMVILSGDNSILVTGSNLNPTNNVFIAHFTSSGSIDTSFGTSSGSTITSIGDASLGNSIGIQSTGAIIVGGIEVTNKVPQGFIARYTSSGILDTTFGTSGITSIALNQFTSINAIIVQSDDTILAVGTTQIASSGVNQFVIVHLNSDGSFDTGFGSNGITTTTIGTNAQANSVQVQSTGTIVVGGFSDSTFALACYTTSGILDTTFGTNGITTTSIGSKSFINAILIDSSDTIYAAGSSDHCFVTAHYNSSGILDTAFGNNGNIIIMQDSVTQAVSLAQESNSLIIAAGNITNDLTMERYTVNNGTGITGTIDNTFTPNGIVNAPATPLVKNVAIVADMKISGTDGGTFTSGSWQTRTLNIIKGNYQFISLSNNQFTLQPGIYSILALAPAYNVNSHQLMLENITTGNIIAYGTNEFAVGSQTRSNLIASASISAPQTYALNHQCSSTQTTNGFGHAAGFGPEIYAVIIITQLTL